MERLWPADAGGKTSSSRAMPLFVAVHSPVFRRARLASVASSDISVLS
jgi:hypothetical protein